MPPAGSRVGSHGTSRGGEGPASARASACHHVDRGAANVGHSLQYCTCLCWFPRQLLRGASSALPRKIFLIFLIFFLGESLKFPVGFHVLACWGHEMLAPAAHTVRTTANFCRAVPASFREFVMYLTLFVLELLSTGSNLMCMLGVFVV